MQAFILSLDKLNGASTVYLAKVWDFISNEKSTVYKILHVTLYGDYYHISLISASIIQLILNCSILTLTRVLVSPRINRTAVIKLFLQLYRNELLQPYRKSQFICQLPVPSLQSSAFRDYAIIRLIDCWFLELTNTCLYPARDNSKTTCLSLLRTILGDAVQLSVTQLQQTRPPFTLAVSTICQCQLQNNSVKFYF